VHPPPQSLAQLAVLQRRDPQLGHQVSAAELGEHARVDLVGLAGERRDVADLAGVRDLHTPAGPRASWSRTQIAPPIISTTVRTPLPRSITNLTSPSASAGTAPSPTTTPASLSEHHAARR
jgi:hypothetical protein